MKKIIRKYFFVLISISFILLTVACDEKKDAELSISDKLSPSHSNEKSVPIIILSREEAINIIKFYNSISFLFDSGWYALPSIIMKNVHEYKKNFKLEKLPFFTNSREKVRNNLLPPFGVFSKDIDIKLSECVNNMDIALDNLCEIYDDFKKYVDDENIKDDGVMGEEFIKKIVEQNNNFLKAKSEWFGLITIEARKAEDKLLENHVFKEQIMAARDILSAYSNVATILSGENLDRSFLEEIIKNIELLHKKASEPSKEISYNLQNTFNQFLEESNSIIACLKQGLVEGFYDSLKQEFNKKYINARDYYNNFVTVANY